MDVNRVSRLERLIPLDGKMCSARSVAQVPPALLARGRCWRRDPAARTFRHAPVPFRAKETGGAAQRPARPRRRAQPGPCRDTTAHSCSSGRGLRFSAPPASPLKLFQRHANALSTGSTLGHQRSRHGARRGGRARVSGGSSACSPTPRGAMGEEAGLHSPVSYCRRSQAASALRPPWRMQYVTRLA